MAPTERSGKLQARQRRIAHRTKQLTATSRILYRIEHYSALASVAVVVPLVFVGLAVLVAVFGFPDHWVASFEVSAAVLTLIMVFTIQHTQTREQAATQRKLDELLRATPGAAESLMMLEEAPETFVLEVEEDQRALRSELAEENPDGHFT